jgi:hypothetical protein
MPFPTNDHTAHRRDDAKAFRVVGILISAQPTIDRLSRQDAAEPPAINLNHWHNDYNVA